MNMGLVVLLRLAALFSDHMVLQRDMTIPVWGWANTGSQVTVELAGHCASATAGADGKWLVRLPALPAGGPHTLTVRTPGAAPLVVTDVLVGEVWLCSGQSNMALPLSGVKNAKAELAAAEHPNIRLFQVPLASEAKPLSDIKARWEVCTEASARTFSAVAYFHGLELQRRLDVPIGLIHSSRGGTTAEAWTSREGLNAEPTLHSIVAECDRLFSSDEKAVEEYRRQFAKWEQACGNRQTPPKPDSGPIPPAPSIPPGPDTWGAPCALYLGMIAPLAPYAVRGVIWYQGEGNVDRAYQYRTLFPALIRNWRQHWGQDNLYFHFVQLPNYTKPPDQPGESHWAELREAQTMTLALPDTAMAVTIDVGEENEIHPTNKQDVGCRLAWSALSQIYGLKDVTPFGPLYKGRKVEGSQVRVSFDHLGGGLEARGGALKAFAIAGTDKKFFWADARIDGDTVVVSSPEVSAPVAVRYGWADNPPCNLYNRAGLPASPFRTDDWSPQPSLDNL